MTLFEQHKEVQAIAKYVLNELVETINENDSEKTISQRAKLYSSIKELQKPRITTAPHLYC